MMLQVTANINGKHFRLHVWSSQNSCKMQSTNLLAKTDELEALCIIFASPPNYFSCGFKNNLKFITLTVIDLWNACCPIESLSRWSWISYWVIWPEVLLNAKNSRYCGQSRVYIYLVLLVFMKQDYSSSTMAGVDLVIIYSNSSMLCKWSKIEKLGQSLPILISVSLTSTSLKFLWMQELSFTS